MVIIDNSKLYSKNNIQDIILHNSEDGTPAISPNNCSFLISLNSSVISMYTITLLPNKGEFSKVVIAK